MTCQVKQRCRLKVKNLNAGHRKKNAKNDIAGKKTSFFRAKQRHNQKRAQSKMIAKTIGDKRKNRKIPVKIGFFCRPCLPQTRVGQVWKISGSVSPSKTTKHRNTPLVTRRGKRGVQLQLLIHLRGQATCRWERQTDRQTDRRKIKREREEPGEKARVRAWTSGGTLTRYPRKQWSRRVPVTRNTTTRAETELDNGGVQTSCAEALPWGSLSRGAG